MNTPFHPIQWADTMATGFDTIDRQHHFLIDTLQEANEKLLDEDGNTQLNKVTKDLLSYAITHFETEEKLMQQYDYAAAHPEEAHNHIEQHRDFSRQVVGVCDQLRKGQEISRIELLTFLNHWLRNHVLGVDQLLGEFLRQVMTEADRQPER